MNLYSVNVYTNNLSVGDAQTLSIAIKDNNNIIIIHDFSYIYIQNRVSYRIFC